MTPEELDEARAKEAQRLWESGQEAGSSSWVVAARLARENWTPPEPVVDPDVLAFREWRVEQLSYVSESEGSMTAKAFLAGARMAREQERKRAKVLEARLSDLVERVTHDGKQYVVTGIKTHEMISARDILAKYRGEA